MSNSLEDAFNAVLQLTGRVVQLERPGAFSAESIKVSMSNYFRNLAAPEEVIIEGREYVVSQRNLNLTTNYRIVKRGDAIVDPILGEQRVTEVREMFGLGGTIIGYRVRTA